MDETPKKEKFDISVISDKDDSNTNLSPDNQEKSVLNTDSLRDYLGIQEKAKSSDPRERISFYLDQIKEGLSQNLLWQEITYFWTPKKIGFIFALGLIAFLLFFVLSYVDFQKGNISAQYRLVPEKVSKSAAIKISLPIDINVKNIEERISFEPKLEGDWINRYTSLFPLVFADNNQNQFFYFKPKYDLETNKYYEVLLSFDDGKKIGVDFLAVDNPKTIAVFPDDKLEADESSKITIVFNRQMIDPSKVGQLSSTVPVEIYPKVEGDFTWLSDTTLQLVPKNKLIPSTDYKVKIKKGFVSIDGVNVPEADFSFKTRNVRYLNDSPKEEKKVIYNEPIRIYFNQPVNLEKIIKETRLYDSENKELEFYAQYAKSEGDDVISDYQDEEVLEVYSDEERDKTSMADYGLKALTDFISSTIKSINPINVSNEISTPSLGNIITDNSSKKNKSVIEIYNKANSNNYLWALNSKYTLEINKIYPLHGNIYNEGKKTIAITSGDIVNTWSSVSQKTSETSLDFFDPSGALSIKFYEEIDASRVKINSSGKIVDVKYGQKCNNDELSIYDSGCIKIPDKKNILIYFSENNLNPNQKIEISLEEIYSVDGRLINKEPIKKTLKVYDYLDFNLGKVVRGSNLSVLAICSTSPLLVPEKNQYGDFINANFDYEIFSWNQSWLQSSDGDSYCPKNSFTTIIDVGFMPEKDYELKLNFEDIFGQRKTKVERLRTSKMESGYMSIASMQKQYVVTLPEKTVLSFSSQNIDNVDIKICKKTDGYSFYSDLNKRGKDGDNHYIENNEIDCLKVVNSNIKLGEKYWINNYFNIDIKKYFNDPIGNYVIKVSNSNYNNAKGIYSYLTITNLAVAEKRTDINSSNEDQDFLKDLKNIYWVTDVKTQNPISNAKVKLYSNGKIIEGDTNNEGVSLISPVKNMEVAVVENGSDSTIVGFNGDSINLAGNAFSIKKSYIYTDKSNYLPGETVNIKGLLRTGYDGKYEVLGQKANVYVLNSKGVKISEQEIKLDDSGIFISSINLTEEASLGLYSICATDYNCGYFSVLQGGKNNLIAEVKTDKEEYISKDVLSMNIDANYYFGVPVENGIVDYTVSAKNYYFDRSTGDYNFNYINDDFSDKFLFKDTVKLDSNGKVVIKKQIDLDKFFGEDKQSKILTFDIIIKDSFGQSISQKKTVIFHSGESYLGVALNSYFISKDSPVGIRVLSVDINGKARQLKNIDVLINKIDWIRSGNNWEKEITNVKKLSISVGIKGEYYSNSQKISSEGEYEILLVGTDSKNNKIYTKSVFYVYGDEDNIGIQIKDDFALNLKTNKDRLREGESGEVIIESPYMKGKALITLERGKIFDYKIVDVVGGFYNYKFKAQSFYAPNVYVSVLLQTSTPTVNFAMKSFNIESDENKLSVSLTPDKKSYGPGETVRLRVFTAKAGGGVSSNFSLSVVGSNALTLNDPQKDPFAFFYSEFPLTVSTSSNIRNVISKEQNKSEKSVANNLEHNVPFLQNSYSDVVYWKGNIKTGNDGRADIVFELPDVLAYWKAEAVAITSGSKIGVAYLNFNTEKELTAIPLKPKFIIPGDTFYVGARISNQSKNKKSVKVSFTSDTLLFTGNEKEVVLNVEKDDSQSVYFSVSAPKNYFKDFHNFSIDIKGDNIDEKIEQNLMVLSDTTYLISRTSNYSNENKISEAVFIPKNVLKDGGSLSIRGGTNLSIFFTDGLNSFIKSPYKDANSISASLKLFSKIKRVFEIDNPYNKFNLSGFTYDGRESNMEKIIEDGLVNFSRMQSGDGGFSLFGDDNSDNTISCRVLEAFAELENAGIIEDEDQRFIKLYEYVKKILDAGDSTEDEKVSAVYALLSTKKFLNDGSIKNHVSNLVKNSTDKLSINSLAKLGVLTNSGNYGWGLSGKINDLLDKKVISDARGIYLGDNSKNNNQVINTATYLKSIVSGKRDKDVDGLIKWILNSRTNDGSWGSVQNTEIVMDTLIDYINWKKETNAEYYTAIKLNGNDFDNYQFNSTKVFDQLNKKISIGDMSIGAMNLIDIDKSNHRPLFKDKFYYDISLNYSFDNIVNSGDNGFTIKKSFYPLNYESNSRELNSAQTGDVLRAHLEIVVPENKNSVMIEDFIPAGMEILDMDLIADQKLLRSIEKQVKNNFLYPEYKEIKNDRAMIYKRNIDAGVYEFDYYVKALIPGRYLGLPTVIKNYDNPNEYGHTSSFYFEIK
ncbi:MG2 domain-containing protein [bacterium]|nr:MG2 domain-containing protein [bacterium]